MPERSQSSFRYVTASLTSSFVLAYDDHYAGRAPQQVNNAMEGCKQVNMVLNVLNVHRNHKAY